MNYKPFIINLSNTRKASAILIQDEQDIADAVIKLGLASRPTMVLVGGAARLDKSRTAEIHRLFHDALAPAAQALRANVIDGATDSGVIRMMGTTRQETAGTFSLIGVAAVGTVALPMQTLSNHGVFPLEPHHTNFILVPGNQWGDESRWIARVARQCSIGQSSVTVLINGGDVTLEDALNSVKENRPVIVVAGSGRTADLLAGVIRGESSDERVRDLVHTGLLSAIELRDGPKTLRTAVETALSNRRIPAYAGT